MGTISDTLPILGYHKRIYILGSAVLGSVAMACLALVPFGPGAAALVSVLFFCCHLEVCVCGETYGANPCPPFKANLPCDCMREDVLNGWMLRDQQALVETRVTSPLRISQ